MTLPLILNLPPPEIYTEIPSGGALASGCAVVTTSVCIEVAFAEGDAAFVREDAIKRGELTKIVVKRVMVDPANWVPTKVVDTYNGVWFEYELVNHSTAIDLAREYHELRALQIQEMINSLSCN
jgi:hypothetical protein